MPDLIGQSIDRYHILEPLGEGGMAVVYKAFDTRLERYVAIKVITPSQEHSEQFLKRFEREARALAQLSHPNIIKVLDYGEQGGLPYLVMEYIPGGTLKSRLKPEPMDWREAAKTLIPIAEALDYAHQQGIIHRDVKPSNILLTASGQPMLTDFGIAKILQSDEATADLTGTGVGIGTPEYMAPEQGAGHGVDQRADIYALGIILYEMVTGRKPYEAVTPMAVLLQKMTEPLPRPRQINPALPEALERVLVKSLAKEPGNRYQTAAEFGLALQNLIQPAAGSTPLAGGGTAGEEASPPGLLNRRNLLIAAGVLLACGCVSILIFGSSRLLATLGGRGGPTLAPAISTSDSTSTPRASLPATTPELVPPESTPTLLFPTDTPFPTEARAAGGEWIAFASARNGSNDIYTMRTDGSEVTQLTTSSADDRVPSWSPDGKRIAYQSNVDGDFELNVLSIADRKSQQITSNTCDDFAPVWSPDGKMFAYYSDCDGNREIYTVNTDGSGAKQITFTEQVYNWFPNWSPDGREITYSSNRSGRYEVLVMSASGKDATVLARGCVSSFSPDGSMILFSQYCTDDGDIYVMDSDGTSPRTVVENCDCSNPSWSADGTQIVFQRVMDGNYDIWKVNLDGRDMVRLTDDPARDSAPVWQPAAAP